MKIVFCKHTALFLLRLSSTQAPAPASGQRYAPVPSAPLIASRVRENPLFDQCPRPLHVLALDRRRPRPADEIVFNTWSARVTPRRLVEPFEGLCCLGPELTLLHLATSLHPLALLMLAHELCGRYRICQDPPGFFEAEPLTNTRRLSALVEASAGVPGAKPLRTLLPYLSENARSPMESAVALMVGLPQRLGGLGLPRPTLNQRISPGRRGRAATSAHFYDCDLFWPQARLALEYDSDLCHTGADRLNSDAARRTALLALGITVVTATRDQIYRPRQFRQLETTLRRQLGVRRQVRCADFERRQEELRRYALGTGLRPGTPEHFVRFGR